MTKSFRNISAVAAIAAGLVTLATPAVAGTAAVTYADLDLTSAAGRAELDKRIDDAAASACKAQTVTGSRISKNSMVERCVSDAKKQINAQIARRTTNTGLGG
jgi:UrcA family protein